ncbi:uncharacterized protein LOC101857532 isoform X2 [Aplysia californica]|uniref:Uncharacterized protein LOC101857532 isoform X2 n=1 Tax=Aplysia californica TaxID=6500 RepID=A0ABM0JCG1_APLCA|nr:uncharacterized protein LOC101857532 isoform X2 [Aplysia californica]
MNVATAYYFIFPPVSCFRLWALGMPSVEESRYQLKLDIVSFLSKCPKQKHHEGKFWNRLQTFTGKPLLKNRYGVTKLNKFFEIFDDVIFKEDRFICLRGDNDSLDESKDINTQGSEASGGAVKMFPSQTASNGYADGTFEDRMVSVLKAHDGTCKIWTFLDAYCSAYGKIPTHPRNWPVEKVITRDFYDVVSLNGDVLSLKSRGASAKGKPGSSKSSVSAAPWGSAARTDFAAGTRTKKSQPTPIVIDSESDDEDDGKETLSSFKNSAGFIAFSNSKLSQDATPQGQTAHSRYSLSSGGAPASAGSTPFMGPSGSNIRPGPSGPPMGPPMSAPPQSAPWATPSPRGPLIRAPWHGPPGLAKNLVVDFTKSAPPQMPRPPLEMYQNAFASPALVVCPPPSLNVPTPLRNAPTPSMPSISEWPVQRKRTGPPPGTKITEEREPVVVRHVQLPRQARLTAEQVNYELQTCIEDLAASGDHVSLELVENLLLQKFKVHRFQDLRLRECSFVFLPAGKDHSNMLSKVNSYVQNFVRSRSTCTLFELHECLREFHSEKKEFELLKLGPLQKMPVVFDMFKFPEDEYIPEITSQDLMENLNNFLDRYNKWQQQVTLTEFMEYLTTEVYEVERAYSLGIRIRSLPLAIQTLKKSKRDAGSTRRMVMERLKELLYTDIQECFYKFRTSVMQTASDGSQELRKHYMNLEPEVALQEIYSKFEVLLHLFVGESGPDYRKYLKSARQFQQFVQSVVGLPLPRMVFHLAICLSNTEVQDSAAEFMAQEAEKQQQAQTHRQEANVMAEKKQPPTKAALTDKVILYINRCIEHGTLQLNHLQRIETRLLEEDFRFQTFHEMGYGSFLDFIITEKKVKALLDECGGTSLGQGGGHDGAANFLPSQLEILEFVCQARKAGSVQNQQVERALCEQYHVTDVRHLGHGNVSRLCNAAAKPGKHAASVYHTHFESALCGKSSPSTHSLSNAVGNQGSQSRLAALACLTRCPLLTDMAEWSHWKLVFQPQHGPLRDFVQKYGGQTKEPLEGGNKTAVSDFMALEVEPGKLLKLTSRSNPADFVSALDSCDAVHSAGVLVSIIVANGGLESTPLALLANHVTTQLFSLHARSPSLHTPGGPPAEDSPLVMNLAVQFVTDILLTLPVRIATAIGNQVLLEPLSQVVGSAKSKSLVLQVCTASGRRERLELLGCLLGLPEWTESFTAKCSFPLELVTEILADEIMGGPELDTGLDEDDDNDDDDEEEEESDIDEILSSDGSEVGESSQLQEGSKIVEGQKMDQGKEASGEDEEDSEDDDDDEEEEQEDDEEEDTEDEDEEKEKEKAEENGESEAKKGEEESIPVNASRDASQTGMEDGQMDSGKEENPTAAEPEVRERTREEVCCEIVENIRRDEFGVGVKLDETGEKLLKKQQERQGRSLQRLSKDLYSKDTHFVLELIQNADDNAYTEPQPAVKFIIDHSGVTVQNNEMGFEEKNIRALCDVGKSTKAKHNLGYIGQKGIGFKSVFRVTGRPEVHSNGFHICFDVHSGPMGYILPHWIESSDLDEKWQTHIILPWTEEIKQHIRSHAARFNDIQPTLLLFLHRLKEVTIKNEVEGSELHMVRRDLEDGEVQIRHEDITDRWLVLRKILDASSISLQAKSGVNVESTEIALAFPLKDMNQVPQGQKSLSKLPVFAFLPLRSYGFRFIVQGDFDVPSSREDVDRDSSWNQWLRNEIPALFVEALDSFKLRQDLSPVEALCLYLQFIPLEGEVMGFFTPVAPHILTLLKDKNCIPVMGTDKKGSVQWKKPSQTIICQDSLVREIVSPELLQHQLGLFYIHQDVLGALNEALTRALGVSSITVERLLHIGRFNGLNWDNSGNPDRVMDISKWLACIYRSMDDFQDNTATLNTLRSLKIIPLSAGNLVSLDDVTVFLLTDGQGQTASSRDRRSKQANARDPLLELKKDLNLVHGALTSTPDAEVNSQVVKLLLKMDIKQLTPQDLIHSHIMPVLTSDGWKEKSRDVLISYLVYIKGEREQNASVIDMAELRPVARLATNHGIKNPVEDDVHFSQPFGNVTNLKHLFPGIDWTLVDSAYLPSTHTRTDVISWHDFLSQLGVVDFLRVKRVELSLDKSSIDESVWAPYKDIWPDSPDGYTIVDFQCEEFHRLATANNVQGELYSQMVALFEQLDKEWNSLYSRFVSTQLKSASGHVLKETIDTSFSILLRSLAWLPASCTSISVEPASGRVIPPDQEALHQAAELYVCSREITKLLAHTVKYLKVQPLRNSTFSSFLKVKSNVSVTSVKDALISWSARDASSPDTARAFSTTYSHISELYRYLNDNLSRKDGQDLFHTHPVIFVPDGLNFGSGRDPVAGRMLSRKELWWADPTELFVKYHDSLLRYKSPLAKTRIIGHLYQEHSEMFHFSVKVPTAPSTAHLAQLVDHLATVFILKEPGILEDTLYLFSEIGSQLIKISHTTAGVATEEAQLAQTNLPLVKELFANSALFPTKLDQWVALSAAPMLSDSSELEEMFLMKPGVHFLRLEADTPGGQRENPLKGKLSQKHQINAESVKYLVSLFEEIRPLSECVTTTEITTGFEPCTDGQTYLHRVVGLVQRFLYFSYSDVYRQVKEKKAEGLKDLLFTQVWKLEVRYELTDRPDVYEIRSEKCIVKDKHFYFHKDAVESQSEINREVAKFFSEGNEDCIRELRSFLSQVVPIIEGISDESIESLMSRQKAHIGTLPSSEEVWEVPLPVIKKPEPEPQLEVEETMVYGKAVYEPSDEQSASTGNDGNAGLKSWPPRSGEAMAERPNTGKTGPGPIGPSSQWPPPEPSSHKKSSRDLPSTIRFEEGEEMEKEQGSSESGRHQHTARGEGTERQNSSSSHHGGTQIYRQTSETGSKSGVARSESADGSGGGSRPASGTGGSGGGGAGRPVKRGEERAADDASRSGGGGGGGGSWREGRSGESGAGGAGGTRGDEEGSGGGGSQCMDTGDEQSREGGSNPGSAEESREEGKRKLTDGSQEEMFVPKRLNSHDPSEAGYQSGREEGNQANRRREGEQHMEGDDGQQSNVGGTGTGSGRRGPPRDDLEDSEGRQGRRGNAGESHGDARFTPVGRKQHKDKDVLHFKLPLWSGQTEELSYTELGQGSNLPVPEALIKDDSQVGEIGRWGEQLVWDYLQRLRQTDRLVEDVIWPNESTESGRPYDFEILFKSDEVDKVFSVFVEVKTTVSTDKEVFPISLTQIRFAMQQGEHYQIYRVFGAGQKDVRLLRIDNVADRMRLHQMKLLMLL